MREELVVMADLQERAIELIRAGHESGGQKAKAMEEPSASITLLTGWLNGIEDAISEIAAEVERLRAANQS
jgi:hypothetical protein